MNSLVRRSTGLKDVCEMGSVRCSTVYPENLSAGSYWKAGNCDDDMCLIDDKDDFGISTSVKFNSSFASADLDKVIIYLKSLMSFIIYLNFSNIGLNYFLIQSFNPMCEPTDDWPCKFDESPEVERNRMNISSSQAINEPAGSIGVSKAENEFTFPCGSSAAEDDEEVTESKIKAFLDEKVLCLFLSCYFFLTNQPMGSSCDLFSKQNSPLERIQKGLKTLVHEICTDSLLPMFLKLLWQ